MKNSHIALVLGNGPSVDKFDPLLLKHVTSYGCNHIGRIFPTWGHETDNVVITDSNRIDEIGHLYKDYHGGLYVGHQSYVLPPVTRIRAVLQRDFVPLKQLKKETLSRYGILDHIRWHKLFYTTVFHKGMYTFDVSKGLNFGFSVVISAIQVAVMNGARTVLLTGVDSSYKTGHDYFAGMATKIDFINQDFIANPRIFMEPTLVLMQIYLEAMGVVLVDCTPGGKLRFINKGRFIDTEPYYAIERHL
jgi:hypothetical protein